MTTKQKLQDKLAERIEEAEAELEALQAVTINTKHKTLTNRAIEGGRIGDYLGIGKALYIYYRVGHRNLTRDITAYTYDNPDGSPIGTVGIMRQSRTMTPAELQASLEEAIEGRRRELGQLETDLANIDDIAKRWDTIEAERRQLLDGLSWAARGVLQ